jgi:hypothetical protein
VKDWYRPLPASAGSFNIVISILSFMQASGGFRRPRQSATRWCKLRQADAGSCRHLQAAAGICRHSPYCRQMQAYAGKCRLFIYRETSKQARLRLINHVHTSVEKRRS